MTEFNRRMDDPHQNALLQLIISALTFRNRYLDEQQKRKQAEQEKREAIEQGRLDGLTGLYNKEYFNEILEKEVARAKRTGKPLSVIMLDLDHFKYINDTYGHEIGDEVLKGMVGSIRITDYMFRWGGEEFFMILPDTSLKGALRVAERSRIQLANNPIVTSEAEINVTGSFGVAQFNKDETIKGFMNIIDQLLYAAKKGVSGMTGRNLTAFRNEQGNIAIADKGRK